MADDWLQIRNWDKWQHYRKDRNKPPWIKLYRRLSQDLNWVSLTDAQRGQLTAIWILAADRDGLIPSDPIALKKLCLMDSEPDLQLFIEKGFIEPVVKNANHGCQVGNQNSIHVRLEENRREEIREEIETEEVCSEPGETPAPSRPPDEPTEFVFECVGKGAKSWTLPKSKMDEYLESYPGLDVRSEIRKARQWIRDNPTKRKTAGTGMLRFLTSWLNRAQNSGGNHVSTRPGRSGPQIGPGQRYDPTAEGGTF